MESKTQKLPVPIGDQIKADRVEQSYQIFAGGNQTFLISGDTILGCGDNSVGQLGLEICEDGCARELTVIDELQNKVD